MRLRDLIAGIMIAGSFMPRESSSQTIDNAVADVVSVVKSNPDGIRIYSDIFDAYSCSRTKVINWIRLEYIDTCHRTGDGFSFDHFNGRIDSDDILIVRIGNVEVTDIGLDGTPDDSRNVPGVDYSAIIYEEGDDSERMVGRWGKEERKIIDWYLNQVKRARNYALGLRK